MALTTENGSGLADAESYCTVAFATTHHAARGNAAWAALASDTVREQLLRKATDYMLGAYRERWAGNRVSTTQALDWPRDNVPMHDGPGGFALTMSYYPNNTVPAAVARACADLALKAATADLAPDLSQAVKSKEVGPVKIEYQDYSRATKTYRAIDNALAPFMSGSGQIRVLRA